MKRIFILVVSLFFISLLSQAQPTFSSATTTSTTNIRVTFGTLSAHALTAVGAPATYTVSGATITGVAIQNAAAGTVDLTVNTLSAGFSCSNCVTLSAAAATNSDGASVAAGPAGYDVSDGVVPIITATAPASSALKNNKQVSYTLSETITSGSVTWTQTGGAPDAGSPRVQALTGGELTTGAHSNITLTNNPALVDGAIYSVSFDAIDPGSNPAVTITNTNVTYDGSTPVISATAPASGSRVNSTLVSYTLSETIVSGSITWTRTSGPADAGSPHMQALTGAELNSGAHTGITLANNPTLVDGATYSVAFNAADLVNTATAVTNTGIIFDTTPPAITATAPASSALKNNKQVSYTLSEIIASGSITWTQTGGTADAGSPRVQALTGSELTTGAHSNITLTNNPALVDGAIYSVAFDAVDLAGNPAVTITNTDVTYDLSIPTITATAPASNARVNTTKVSYTLSETVASGSITWTRTGGTADAGSPRVQALAGAELNSGAHTAITLTNNPALVNGTIYTVAFKATDAGGNIASTITNTNVTFDTTVPVISATSPSTNAFRNTAKVSYTLSEAIGSGSVTWTRTSGNADAGSPHVQALTGAELNTGAHTNITLTNNPALVDGTVYSVKFDATDIAGNPGTAVTNTGITFDITPPTILLAEFFSSFDPATDPGFTTCSGMAVNNTTAREYVHLTLSEPLGIADGTLVTTGGTGFAASTGTFDVACDSRGATVYHSSNTIHLLNNFASTGPNVDGAWDGNTTFSFTAGGTNIVDRAGNEMASVASIVPGDAIPPALATGMVFFPNGSGSETIVFQLDETLNAAVTNNVTGFTVSAPGLNTLLNNYNAATRTVTLTSTSNGQWTDGVTIAYSQASGNVTDPANNELVAFGAEPIFLTSVHIQSNNANSTRAKTGNTITLTFNAARTPASTPVVTIGGLSAVVTGGPSAYSASVVTTVAVPESAVTFQIDIAEAIKATTVTKTTDDSGVTFDKTPPTITPVTIASNNGLGATVAKVGNTVTLSFTVNEPLISDPIVTLGGRTATLGTGYPNYTYTLLLDGSEPSGVLAFNIPVQDLTGNSAAATAITTGSNVTFDKTAPTITSIKIVAPPTPNSWSTTMGTSATTLTYRVTFSENVTGITYSGANKNFAAQSTGSVSAPNPTGASFTTSNFVDITVTGFSGQGLLRYDFSENDNIIDVAGNPVGGVGNSSFNTSFGPVPNDERYTLVLPEPTNEAFTLTESNITGNSIKVSWTGTSTAQIPTHFLVMAKPTSGSYPALEDGSGHHYINNGALAQNIAWASGTNTWTFSGLSSGTSYDFIVYKYTLSPNNSIDNIDYETSAPAIKNGVLTTTASVGSILLTSTPVTISSLKNASGNSGDLMTFKIFDDGQDPIAPNVMTLFLNGVSQEKIIFNLRSELSLAEGASVTGFTSSAGTVATAIYTGKGTTNTITLTNTTNGTWTSTTTINYSPTTGNAVFLNATLGAMQYIILHAVDQAPEVVQTYNSDGTFIVPAGVTSLVVETWGAGGGGGSGVGGTYYDGGGAGGGGGYSRSTLAVSPGNSFGVIVGQGGLTVGGFGTLASAGGITSFDGIVVANGGTGGMNNTTGNSGSNGVGGPLGIGTVRFTGGSGTQGTLGSGIISPGLGGTGGSSAGTAANGNTGAAPSGGGNGGSGIVNGTGQAGGTPGGGGGGSGNGSGGAGSNGKIVITYSSPTAPVAVSDWAGDNAPLKFSKLIVTQGPANDAALANWQNIIAGAQLFDGSTTISGLDVAINSTNITFSNIPSTNPGDFGFVPDAVSAVSSKTYTLKVWLRDDLSSSLAAVVDGLHLDFKFDPTNPLNFVYDDTGNKSSRLVATHPAIQSGANEITVDATQLDFSTNPVSPVFVSTNVTAISVAPDLSLVPVVRARDVNGNTDKDYAGALTVSNTGTLPMANSTLSMSMGVAPFLSAFQYLGAGNGTLTVSKSGLTSAVSAAVTVNYSNTTKISAGDGYEIATFPSTNTSLYSQLAFDFAIDEDNLAGGDGSPTRINKIIITGGAGNDITDWSQALAGAMLYDADYGFNPYPVGTIGTNSITFSGIDFSANNRAGYISDNTRKNYQLYVWLKPTLGGTLPSTIDNLNFVFEVLDENIFTEPTSSAFTGSESANSGGSNNAVTVLATKLAFTTNPATSLLVGKDISAQLPVPVVEALDVNNNRDLNYNSTTVTTTNSGSLTMTNTPANGSLISGLLTFPSGFKFNTTGTGVKLTIASTGPSAVTNALSTSFDVLVGNAATITTGPLAEPSTISSLVDLTHTPSGLAVFDFTINDDPGGTPANEDDGNPTQLTSLTITSGAGNTVSNWFDAFATAKLSDGTNTVTVTTIDASNYFYFDLSSVAGQALGLIPDDGSKTYTLTVWLKTALGGTLPTTIDGQNFVFDVQKLNITTGVNSTAILAGQTQNSGAGNNKVQVIATQIDYTTQPTTASVSVPVVPQIIVSARDLNTNLDRDFIGTITATGNIPIDPGPFTTTNDPIGSFGSFAPGQLQYPPNFQFTVGDGDAKLTITAGGISGTSATISTITSYDSWLYFDPTFAYTPKIDFVNKQEDPITGTSQVLARLILSDGGSATSTTNATTNPNPGLKNQSIHQDGDGSFTRITDFTISLSNYQDIRKIALYASDGVTKIGADKTPAATVTFTGLNSSTFQAPDDGIYTFYIRASFAQTVTDLDQIAMQVTAVTHNSGSKFSEQIPVSPPATIAGVNGAGVFGDLSPLNIAGVPVNLLDVIATSLDFTTQATTTSSYAGIDEPVGNIPPLFTVPFVSAPLPSTGASILSARDKFANLDTGFNATPTITQTAGPNTPVSVPRNFVNGILRLDGMEYPSTGNGTLQVIANGIDSSNPPVANILAIPGSLVNVVNVKATIQLSNVLEGTGVPLTYSIKGGSLDQAIFGVTFTASGATASEPTLKKFSILFNKSFHAVNGGVVTDIFTNFRVLRGTTDITSLGGSLSYSLSTGSTDDPGSQDIIIVDLTSSPQSLFGGPISYYLVADVDPTANLSTPTLTPRIDDGGYGSTTDANIVVSQGTASGTFDGNVYTFASTKPPVLLTAKNQGTIPFSGQLNVSAGLNQIKLKFDVSVTSLDGGLNNGAELFNRTTNVKVADLVAVPGLGNYLSTHDEKQVINPLTFDLNFVAGQSLLADEVYYVTIKKGSFDPISLTGTGISDQGLNFFGGISSNAILYFKIASDKPLKLVNIESTFNNRDIGTLTTNFDQFGTAYYLVVPAGAMAPTNAQVITPSTYLSAPKAAFGNYIIDRINALQTVSFLATYTLGLDYDIYVYAENDAPTPVPSGPSIPNPSGGVYGTDRVAGSGGYTLRITVPGSNVVNNKPDYLICPSSFVTLSEPIIIGESSLAQFKSASVQNFNVLLPPGYEFDVTTYPSVQLIGGDFGGNIATMNFVSNTVLNISYINNPLVAATTDYILISNLRIRGSSGSANQQILRFYGTNTLTPPITNIGTIGLIPTTQFNFTNSYSETNKPFPSPSPTIVNSIPDNYIDSDPAIEGSIRLNPIISVLNDYSGSTFSGTGVTNDLLTLSAVANNTAFNINMMHVDPNGCVSQKSQQYLVYDHRSSISKKLGTAYPLTPQEGTAQALVNVNFPTGNSPVISSPTILHNELAGYRLINLSSDLPASEIRLNATGGRSQIISGSTWRTIVKNVILIPPTPPSQVDLGTLGIYYDYTWDYSHILNAASNGIAINPYDGEVDTDPNSITGFLFRKTSGKNTYWTGGSLGKVEFTGVYRSSADLTVIVPFRQQIELFVPPVPVVEVGTGNQTPIDITDPLNPVSPSNPGTPIFCEQGGAIPINGFPASSATSTGVFDITTLADVPILHNSLSFVDNGNGTATLYPYLISGGINVGFNNSYQDFKITYRFQENNSPAFGTSSIIIRVSANPVAKFIQASDLTAGSITLGKASAAAAFCASIPIIFDPSSSTIAADNIASFNWNFGDINSVNNIGSSTIGSPTITNNYPTIGTYRTQLTVTSDWGCSSINTDNFADITVGSIPTFPSVAFDLVGISKDDQITFTDRSTAASNATSFSKIQNVVWNYGDATTPNATGIHQYSTPGHYKVKSLVTTAIGQTNVTITAPGCERSFDRNIVILDKKTGYYEDDFEGVTNWQFIQDSLNTNGLPSSQLPSWALGTPATGRASINSTPVSSVANAKVWATGLTTTFSKEERSFLYSPAVDMTGFIRPMISFDANWDLEKDGLVLEYSTDNLNVADPVKTWNTVGKNNTGVKWFNDQVIGSKPGKQISGDIGWSGASKSVLIPTGWVQSKSELTSTISGPRNNVVFRFAFATINDGGDGFAFDNFRIGERTRTILLENFTTTNGISTAQNASIKIENDTIRNFNKSGLGTTVVKLNYHIGFTKSDPFNVDNAADPSARALYYNVKDVPWAFLDGNRPTESLVNPLFSDWGTNAYNSQTLQLGQVDITIPTPTVNADGSIKFDVQVKALYDLPANTVVQVVMIEQAVTFAGLSSSQKVQIATGETTFDYVLKKMLPNALGTKFGTALNKNQTRTFTGFEYYPDPAKLYDNPNDLAIIVFLQNEETKEVYQTEFVTGILDPPTVTGVGESPVLLEDIVLFPNPADNELTVRLPAALKEDTRLRLADQVGKIVYDAIIPAGAIEKKVNTTDMAAGMYFLQVESGKDALTRKKVMVVHNH